MHCQLRRNGKNATPVDFKFDDVTFSGSVDLNDGSQVGIQAFEDLKNADNRKFSLGYKKALNKWVSLKAKFDTKFNVSLYSEYKWGNGVVVQGTVASNCAEDFRSKGFLGNNFALGLKLKYDS